MRSRRSKDRERHDDDYDDRGGSGHGEGDLFSDLIESVIEILTMPPVLVCIGLVIVLWFGSGWVDSTFGWGIRDWVKGLFAR